MKLLDKIWHDWLRRPHRLYKSFDAGQGHTILVIHGLGTTAQTWQPLVKQIDGKKWRVIGYDLLGFGKSPRPDYSSYDVNTHARALLASLDNEVKKQKIIIVGHSMGCLVASHIAWLKPEMVAQMILYEPPLFADSPEFRSHKRLRELYFAFYDQILRRPKALLAYSKLVAKFAAGQALDVSEASWLPFERSLKNTIMKQQAYDELKIIQVPTDIIYGKFDFIVTRQDVRQMLEANKYITFHLVNEMHDVTNRAARYIIRLLKTPGSV